MKRSLFLHMITVAFAVLIMDPAVGGEPLVQTLADSQLAQIHGGFCPFEYCENAPGSGVCQPVAAVPAVVCGATKCTFVPFGGVASGCLTVGPVTCTAINTYRQCILAFKLSYCSYGPPICGVKEQGDCYPVARKCICEYNSVGQCDWTSCVP
jgi:hypothetical protein